MIAARGIGKGMIAALALAMLGLAPVSVRAETPKNALKNPAPETRQAGKPAKIYGKDYVGGMQSYVAKYEDTMVQIARTFNVGFVELRSANPFLDPWMPGEGKKMIIPTMHLLPSTVREGVVINLAEMRMYIFGKAGQEPKTFPLGIGREGLLTPSGTTTIVSKRESPVWRPTPRMRREHPELPVEVPAGPDNPLGTHALYLGWPEYRIHGTDKPFSIGRRSSSGCIRMYPEDIIKAYAMLPVGIKVTVVDQPVKVGWIGDSLYLEAHPTADQADKMELDGGLPGYVFAEEDLGLIVAAAGEYARDLDWPLIRQIVRERRGYPVEVYKRGQRAKAREILPESAVPEKANPEKAEAGQEQSGVEKAEVQPVPAPGKRSAVTVTPN